MKTRHLRRSKRNRKNSRRMRRNNKKIYNMRGCSHKYNCKCRKKNGGSGPIGGLPIKGGGCGVPGPFVGAPYNVNNGGNYYGPEYKSGGFDYQRQMQLRGGGMVPDNLSNIGRNIINGGQSIYNGVAGYKAPPSIWPWQDQGKMV